ncbi:uncharacterized protein KY384_007842 [Bacidia gigantensis]|uniref:uncharacterized protein n=1 Tax=Bacidia gigantensis TaxID=2732470 RepID=UPI001D054E06|nr:uncharacterized protein KY384_007842 [Bacidia gigantensis]KAG8527688.1 hypothetical protein KY384_007842 [Bacidia gigantensis]
MSSRNAPSSPKALSAGSSSFYTQRAALINDISLAMEHVLQNINKLNRSLEGVITVGNEFGAVEALWSQFEGVMAKDETAEAEKEEGSEGEEEERGEDSGEEGGGADGGEVRQAKTGRNRSGSRGR